MEKLFYSGGLKFSCTKCSACCRHDPGFVFLRKSDTEKLEKALKIPYTGVMDAYCRWVPSKNGILQLSLKEKANYDCIFWENGCRVYEFRPLQCRSFPFWQSVLKSEKAWKENAEYCPGVGRGRLHSGEIIEDWLKELGGEEIISKQITEPRP